MRILVYGAGAVGCYVGGHLALAGHSVTLLGRERIIHAIQTNGLAIQPRDTSADPLAPTVLAETNLDRAMVSGSGFDLILFTMKAYDTVAAIEELLPRLKVPTPIVCLQNGVGNEESLQSALGQDRVVGAALTTAVSMDTPGQVVEEKRRGLTLATDSPGFSLAFNAFQATALTVGTLPDTRSLKWSKLLLNCIANATSAILDMPPQEVLSQPPLFRIEILALRETLSVLRLLGIPPANLPGAPAATLARALRLLPIPFLYFSLRRQFSSGRGGKLPSLMLALRSRQPITEVAWLNGAVPRAAQTMSRLAPINHTLALLVSDISSGRVPWEVYRLKPNLLATAVRAAQGSQHWRYGE